MNFASYNLERNLLSALQDLGYVTLTPIQEATLPKALKGESFIAKAETGSGKTHAYLVPLINNLNHNSASLQAIILEPTGELCRQVYNFAKELSNLTKDFNVEYYYQSSTLKEARSYSLPTIMVMTPGKLLELIKNHLISLSEVSSLVLDESDMLFEGEAKNLMEEVLSYIKAKQKMIFTATMKEHEINALKKYFGINKYYEVSKNYTSKNVLHHFVDIKHRDKVKALELFLKIKKPYFALVFLSKVKEAKQTYQKLNDDGFPCTLLSSELSDRERKNLLKRINDGEFSLVICSDLASRGLDFPSVSDVISLDIPRSIDYYYHRAGRTGRYKNRGDSYIFYDDELNKDAKKTLESKLTFDYLILRDEGLKEDKKRVNQPKKRNLELEKEIKKAVSKVRSNKVKPNYKKKMRRAAEKAVKQHKRAIIIKNLKSKRKALASVDK